MLARTKLKAFTLLECLIALLVIAGSMTVYQSLTKLTAYQLEQVTANQEAEWLLFCQHLRKELSATSLLKVEGNRLYVKKGQQELAFGKSRKDDFRKTNASGKGYQPMLFKLTSAEISETEGLVQIHLVFDSGLERSFVYAFDKKG